MSGQVGAHSEIRGIMNPFKKIPGVQGYLKRRAVSNPAKQSSPAKVRMMGVIKLASSVGICMSILINTPAAFGLLILPLIYSLRYVPEISSGKIFSQTSARERGVPILLVLSSLLVLIVVFMVWVEAEVGNRATPATSSQQIPQN